MLKRGDECHPSQPLFFKAINQIRRIFFSVLIIIDMQKQGLAILVLLAVSLAQCPANYNINNLVADSVTFSVSTNASSSSQNFRYNFQAGFANAPAVALAVQDFSISYLGPNNFAVYPSILSNSQITFAFDYSSPIWARVKVNFWASANTQIQVGNFKVDNIQTLGSCNCALAYANINTAFGQSDNPVIRVFINGFDISSNSLQVSVSPTNLQGTRLTIKVTVGASTGLRRIWLSWLAFSPSTASFGSYGGQVSQSKYTGSVNSDISNSLYQSPYVFYGLNLISLSNSQALAFTSSISNDFVLSISASSLIDDFSLVYIAVGVLPGKICSACGNGLLPSGNNCVASCPAGSYAFTYRDGGIACRTCSARLGLILSNGRCVQGSTTSTSVSTSTVISSSAVNSTLGQNRPANSVSSTQTTISTSSSASAASSSASASSAAASSPTAVPTPNVVIAARPTPVAPAANASATSTPVVVPTSASVTTATTATTTSASSAAVPTCPTNSFYNGNECVCDVGYVFLNGRCQVPALPTTVPIIIAYPGQKPCNTTTTTTGSSSSSSSSTSTSSSGSTPAPTQPGSSSGSTPAPARPNSTSSSGSTPAPARPNSTSSSSGSSSQTTSSSSSSCGVNSYDNGLGICVCNSGFYFSNGVCVSGVPCGANSVRASNGSCVCETGFTNFSNTCSRCPRGALWSSAANQCIFVCGQNSAYSSSAGACVCNPGFGLFSGSCRVCPTGYFISEGYCVTCPVNSAYNSNTKNCDCLTGFFTNQWGICATKCGTNEVYNTTTQACSCVAGLGRVNGACQICPSGSTPTNDGGSSCNICTTNQVLVNGRCVCQNGFAFNSANVCTACSSLSNGFIINGVCAVCPGSMIYNGTSCGCPQGKTMQGSMCISQCQNDELLDNNGNCYTCGSNQVISNGACVCVTGYTLNSCGVCTLSCGTGQFAFQGSCASCPLNTVFNSAINGCACPSGFYMGTYGVCERLTLQPVNCSAGQFFDSNNGCIACNSSCATCRSANVCLTCTASGFAPNSQGVCVPRCGDGIIVGSETCDAGSSPSAGCVNCQIATGFICSGQPSVCRSSTTATPVRNTTTTTPARNTTTTTTNTSTTASTAALAQFGTTSINSNNVFISLRTSQTFTFANPTQMQSFIQATFPSGTKPTVYCAQRSSPNLNIFDCLLIYPSGVPNSVFTVNFAFNYQGKSGSTSVRVNPLVANNAARTNGARISA